MCVLYSIISFSLLDLDLTQLKLTVDTAKAIMMMVYIAVLSVPILLQLYWVYNG